MARGITQDQVNRAADSILRAGENPTVEKVRAELGTGSPNTVTRMLDSWRRQLGDRLRQLSALPEMPESVGQVMVELWRLASEHAQHSIEGRLADERAELQASQSQLAQERETWAMQLEAAQNSVARAKAAQDLAEHACSTLDGQLQDSHALRADLVQQRDRLQDQYDQQSVQIQLIRSQLDELQTTLQSERGRQEAHIRTVEDRSHHEVDRARQDAKQWQQRLEDAERAHRDAAAAMQRQLEAISAQARNLEQETARQSGQIAGLEKALSEAYVATAQSDRQLSSKAKASTGTPAPQAPSTRPARK